MELPRYTAKSVRVNRRRVYEIAGQRYPGVTTILSATKPAEARAALQRWRQRVGAEEARQIAGQASSVGTRLHQQIAAFLHQEAVTIAPNTAAYWDSICPVLEQIDEALVVEGAVWHADGFVGFPDALVRYQGQLCLCDWKTARQPKRADWITDYFLQAAAYCAATHEVYAAYGVKVEQALIAIALADEPAQTFWLDLEDLSHYWQAFQARLAEYQRRQARHRDR